jgi:hypothetical protein
MIIFEFWILIKRINILVHAFFISKYILAFQIDILSELLFQKILSGQLSLSKSYKSSLIISNTLRFILFLIGILLNNSLKVLDDYIVNQKL